MVAAFRGRRFLRNNSEGQLFVGSAPLTLDRDPDWNSLSSELSTGLDRAAPVWLKDGRIVYVAGDLEDRR